LLRRLRRPGGAVLCGRIAHLPGYRVNTPPVTDDRPRISVIT